MAACGVLLLLVMLTPAMKGCRSYFETGGSRGAAGVGSVNIEEPSFPDDSEDDDEPEDGLPSPL